MLVNRECELSPDCRLRTTEHIHTHARFCRVRVETSIWSIYTERPGIDVITLLVRSSGYRVCDDDSIHESTIQGWLDTSQQTARSRRYMADIGLFVESPVWIRR